MSVAAASAVQSAVQTRNILQTNAIKQEASQAQAVANLVLEGAQNAQKLAASNPPGVGQNLDITA